MDFTGPSRTSCSSSRCREPLHTNCLSWIPKDFSTRKPLRPAALLKILTERPDGLVAGRGAIYLRTVWGSAEENGPWHCSSCSPRFPSLERSRARRPQTTKPSNRKTPGGFAPGSSLDWAGCRMPGWPPRVRRPLRPHAAFVMERMLVAQAVLISCAHPWYSTTTRENLSAKPCTREDRRRECQPSP